MTTKERFIKTGEIQISNHPISGLKRLAILENYNGLIWTPATKRITLNFNVIYLNESGEPLNDRTVPGYFKVLVASDQEYEDLIVQVDNDINIFDIMVSIIQLRDSQGKFDI